MPLQASRQRVMLLDGACDVYWARMSSLRTGHASLLDERERERRRAYLRDEDRARFTLAAALLRVVVGLRLGVAPERVAVDRSCPRCGRPHGRPRVVPPLEVSISHSREVATVAVTTAGAVGVDVEAVRPVAYEPLLDDLCAAEERPHVGDTEAFYRYWTRKESVLKAAGVGLTVPMREVRVTQPDAAPRLLAYPGGARLAARMADASLTDGYIAAVTVLTDASIRFRDHDAVFLLARA
jgi:4'-phosphopantetheinyl transferase